jgi:hypothetical protein
MVSNSRYIHESREVSLCMYFMAYVSGVPAILGAMFLRMKYIPPLPTKWRLQIQTSSTFLLFSLLFNLAEY